MRKDTISDTERLETDYRALIEKSEMSYLRVARKVSELIGEYVSVGNVYRTANPNDEYTNPIVLNALDIILGGKMTQWERLLQAYKNGVVMTARKFTVEYGPTQIHARHIEIRKNAGYKLAEYEADQLEIDHSNMHKIIYWQWEGEGRSKYKRYWIPKG